MNPVKKNNIYKIDGDKFRKLIQNKGMNIKGALKLINITQSQYSSIKSKKFPWSRMTQNKLNEIKSILNIEDDSFYYIPDL